MKSEFFQCDFCRHKIPIPIVAFMCPECGLRHFFELDPLSRQNELFLPEIRCPREKVAKKAKGKGRNPVKKGYKRKR
ncbi:MAG TPA: hypothetical protein ACFYD1_01295 [Candidatus Hypogeohydataceae bacterium YC38]|jgi:hypothetical protein|nr:hypothetical protein [Candidatus Brocadiales bacterium]